MANQQYLSPVTQEALRQLAERILSGHATPQDAEAVTICLKAVRRGLRKFKHLKNQERARSAFSEFEGVEAQLILLQQTCAAMSSESRS